MLSFSTLHKLHHKKLLHQWLAFSGPHSKIPWLFQHLSPNSGLFSIWKLMKTDFRAFRDFSGPVVTLNKNNERNSTLFLPHGHHHKHKYKQKHSESADLRQGQTVEQCRTLQCWNAYSSLVYSRMDSEVIGRCGRLQCVCGRKLWTGGEVEVCQFSDIHDPDVKTSTFNGVFLVDCQK